MNYVYVLFSQKDLKTYTGSTDNLERRISQHQSGKVKATKHRLPIILIYTEEFVYLNDARSREKYYKSSSGRKVLSKILKNKHNFLK